MRARLIVTTVETVELSGCKDISEALTLAFSEIGRFNPEKGKQVRGDLEVQIEGKEGDWHWVRVQ